MYTEAIATRPNAYTVGVGATRTPAVTRPGALRARARTRLGPAAMCGAAVRSRRQPLRPSVRSQALALAARCRVRWPWGVRFRRIEPEGRVGVGHQRGVGDNAQDPAVNPQHKVIERLRIAAGEQQRDAGESGPAGRPGRPELQIHSLPVPVHADQAPPVNTATIRYCGSASSHHFTSTSPRESASGYVTSSRPGSHDVLEREGRIAVGAERAVGVEANAPGPTEDADVEFEQRSRVADHGEEDREERDHRSHQQTRSKGTRAR